MKTVYYAHHQWKYGSIREAEEMELIQERFKEHFVISPSKWIARMEETCAMQQCLHMVGNSDALVFTTLLDDIIGKGVFEEIEMALNCGIPVYLLTTNNEFMQVTYEDFINDIAIIYEETKTNRRYAEVTVDW